MIRNIALATMLTALVATSTHAAGTSTATAPRLIDHIKASYSGVFYGAPVDRPFQSLQPVPATGVLDTDSPLDLKHIVTVQYKFENEVALGPVITFHNYAQKGMSLEDPALKLNKSTIYAKGNLSVYGEILGMPGVSSDSRDIGLIARFIPMITPSYSFQNTRFSLDVPMYADVRVYESSEKITTSKYLKMYFGPQLNAKINSTLSAFLLYEWTGGKKFHTAGFPGMGSDTEIGVSWDITPRVNFVPLFDFKTADRLAIDTTQYMAILNLKIL